MTEAESEAEQPLRPAPASPAPICTWRMDLDRLALVFLDRQAGRAAMRQRPPSTR